MIEVFFHQIDNPGVTFTHKWMESPPRIGEKMNVLTGSPNNPRQIYFVVADILTVIAEFHTNKPETKTVFIRQLDDQEPMTIDQNQDAAAR